MKIMSVDLESWVHRPIFKIPLHEQTKELDNGLIVKSTDIILERFKQHNVRATFFVLGVVAEWYPDLIEKIAENGHEIGIHGYTHKDLGQHTKESFNDEIEKTIAILNGLNIKPKGYRSPCFSTATFLYEVLNSNGIVYDSSVFPIKTPLYDGTKYTSKPFVIDYGIREFPCSMLKICGIRIPAGGFYLRLLGSMLNYLLLNRIEKRNDISVFYCHPWEIMEIPQRHNLPFLKKKFAYYRIPMLKQLEFLLKKLEFTSFDRVLNEPFAHY